MGEITYIGEIPVMLPEGTDPNGIDPFQIFDACLGKEFLPKPEDHGFAQVVYVPRYMTGA